MNVCDAKLLVIQFSIRRLFSADAVAHKDSVLLKTRDSAVERRIGRSRTEETHADETDEPGDSDEAHQAVEDRRRIAALVPHTEAACSEFLLVQDDGSAAGPPRFFSSLPYLLFSFCAMESRCPRRLMSARDETPQEG
jgi:hypothetical protein